MSANTKGIAFVYIGLCSLIFYYASFWKHSEIEIAQRNYSHTLRPVSLSQFKPSGKHQQTYQELTVDPEDFHGIFDTHKLKEADHMVLNSHACHRPSLQPNFTGGGNGSCVELGLSPRKLPLTALASFPGSGNTWTRHLIQQLTGIYTGAVYLDWALKQNGFPGEGKRNGEVIAIKTHHPMYPGADTVVYDQAVVLIRNPYDSLLAYYSFMHGNHTATPGSINATDFEKFIQKNIQLWESFNSFWLNKSLCMYILIYDRLKKDLRKELVALAEFLQVQNLSEKHLDCIVSNAEGNFHRKSHLQDLYSESTKEIVDKLIYDFEDLLSSKLQKR